MKRTYSPQTIKVLGATPSTPDTGYVQLYPFDVGGQDGLRILRDDGSVLDFAGKSYVDQQIGVSGGGDLQATLDKGRTAGITGASGSPLSINVTGSSASFELIVGASAVNINESKILLKSSNVKVVGSFIGNDDAFTTNWDYSQDISLTAHSDVNISGGAGSGGGGAVNITAQNTGNDLSLNSDEDVVVNAQNLVLNLLDDFVINQTGLTASFIVGGGTGPLLVNNDDFYINVARNIGMTSWNGASGGEIAFYKITDSSYNSYLKLTNNGFIYSNEEDNGQKIELIGSSTAWLQPASSARGFGLSASGGFQVVSDSEDITMDMGSGSGTTFEVIGSNFIVNNNSNSNNVDIYGSGQNYSMNIDNQGVRLIAGSGGGSSEINVSPVNENYWYADGSTLRLGDGNSGSGNSSEIYFQTDLLTLQLPNNYSNTKLVLDANDINIESANYINLGTGGLTSHPLVIDSLTPSVETYVNLFRVFGTGGLTSSFTIDNSSNTINLYSSNVNGITVTNSTIDYSADYSSNYTNRSLVDKAYVDAQVGGANSLNEIMNNGSTASITTDWNVTTSGDIGITATTAGIIKFATDDMFWKLDNNFGLNIDIDQLSIALSGQNSYITSSGGDLKYTGDGLSNVIEFENTNFQLTNLIQPAGYSGAGFTSSDFTDAQHIINKGYVDQQITNLDTSNIAYVNVNNNWGATQSFMYDVAIAGNLTVSGTVSYQDVQELQVTDNVITVNYGETGPGVTRGFGGMKVDRGAGTDDYWFGFDEVRDAFTLGGITGETLAQIATTQVVATREDSPTDTAIPYWNDTAKRFDTDTELTYNSSTNVITLDSETISASKIQSWDSAASTTNSLNQVMNVGSTASITSEWNVETTSTIGFTASTLNLGLTTPAEYVGSGFTAGEFTTDNQIVNKAYVDSVADGLSQFLVQTGIGASGALTNAIPAKYRIASIVIEETGGTSAGDISIGTSPGGNDVVNAETIDANELDHVPVGSELFSTSADQTLYISSSAWGSGQVTVHVRVDKFTS